MVDRIKQVMEYKQMSTTAFADAIDINRSSMTHIFSGRNQPSLDVAKKILSAFPEISTEWLIMGIGNMLQDSSRGSALKQDLPPVSVSNVDNMMQTDLFAAMEFAEGKRPTIEKKQGVQETLDADVPNEGVYANNPTPSRDVQSVSDSETISAPVRSRGRASDSHISNRESKRDRISNSQSDKKIAKIIFFYEDKSFDVYTPN